MNNNNEIEYGVLKYGGAFEKENIKMQVLEDVSGVYILSKGERDKDGLCVANYVGRGVVGEVEDLRRRLISHIDNPSDYEKDPYTGECKYKYFWFQYEKTPFACYERECEYYHKYGESRLLDNVNHPARNAGSNRRCPICGKE